MDKYDIWLSKCNISDKIKINLINKFGNSKNLWKCYSNREDVIFYEKSKFSMALEQAWNIDEINNTMDIIDKKHIEVLKFNDELFPNKLRNYDDCPYIIFYYGLIEKLNNINVSIVGSRKATIYGLDATKIITKELCNNNINIISGMAKGIDAQAHKCSIENGSYNCAILGCGIDIIYPKENISIYEQLRQMGCIISQFPPGTKPYPYNFPIRNRLISGLGDITIVVEAGEKSGSLITASSALEQGKDVMAVPGSIFSSESKGTNKLIKDGAYPLTEIKDIFQLLGIDEIKMNNTNRMDIKMSKTQQKINEIINDNPIYIDDLIKLVNIDIKQLYEVLFELQLKDEIICLAGNYYVRVNNKIG